MLERIHRLDGAAATTALQVIGLVLDKLTVATIAMLEHTKQCRAKADVETARLELTLALELRHVQDASLVSGLAKVKAAATTATLEHTRRLDRAAATTAAREHTLDQQLRHVQGALQGNGLV